VGRKFPRSVIWDSSLSLDWFEMAWKVMGNSLRTQGGFGGEGRVFVPKHHLHSYRGTNSAPVLCWTTIFPGAWRRFFLF